METNLVGDDTIILVEAWKIFTLEDWIMQNAIKQANKDFSNLMRN